MSWPRGRCLYHISIIFQELFFWILYVYQKWYMKVFMYHFWFWYTYNIQKNMSGQITAYRKPRPQNPKNGGEFGEGKMGPHNFSGKPVVGEILLMVQKSGVHQLIWVNLTLFTTGFIHPRSKRWTFGISSINRIIPIWPDIFCTWEFPAKRPEKPLLSDPTWIILRPGFPAGCMLHRLSCKKSTSGQPRVPGPLSHKEFI